ncbi:ABC transporter ATP-binding protein [Roseibium sp. M-1]
MLEIENLIVQFQDRGTGDTITACDKISLTVNEAEIVGLVGESGCGKSTLGRTIVGLEGASSGRILYKGRDILSLGWKERRRLRREIQYIFQDPYSALIPRQSVGQMMDEALVIAGERNQASRLRRAEELMSEVGLAPEALSRRPRELSGGQRQRVCIARALVTDPKVLICDEPVSALDVSVRAQVMNLFLRLKEEKGMAILFVAHDLAVVRQAANRVYVMYLGQIMEHGDSQALYAQPMHPYTQSLLGAVPSTDPRIEKARKHIVLEGDVPSPANPPSGCRFRTRCPAAAEVCFAPPPVSSRRSQEAQCHFAGDIHLTPPE